MLLRERMECYAVIEAQHPPSFQKHALNAGEAAPSIRTRSFAVHAAMITRTCSTANNGSHPSGQVSYCGFHITP